MFNVFSKRPTILIACNKSVQRVLVFINILCRKTQIHIQTKCVWNSLFYEFLTYRQGDSISLKSRSGLMITSFTQITHKQLVTRQTVM